jgi:hypothetical protein
MDARQADYPQSGLSSPYPTFPEPASEGTSADQASAAQYPPPGPDPRSSNLTPNSDYSLNPSSARSGSFPEYIQRSYQPGAQGQAPGGMAQQQSPSMPIPDGQTNGHQSPQQLKSDSDVPIDPSIAAQTSPTYASHQQQYSPYTTTCSTTQGNPKHQWDMPRDLSGQAITPSRVCTMGTLRLQARPRLQWSLQSSDHLQ